MSKLVPHHPNMTAEEIAGELGLTVCEVKGALKRALKKLRDGRAGKIRELVIAREKEQSFGLPRFVDYGDMT